MFFLKNALVSEIFPKLSGLFWLLSVNELKPRGVSELPHKLSCLLLIPLKIYLGDLITRAVIGI